MNRRDFVKNMAASSAGLLAAASPLGLLAREELVTYDLVAYQPPLTQVLSLPSVRLERKQCHALRALFQTLNEPGDPP